MYYCGFAPEDQSKSVGNTEDVFATLLYWSLPHLPPHPQYNVKLYQGL